MSDTNNDYDLNNLKFIDKYRVYINSPNIVQIIRSTSEKYILTGKNLKICYLDIEEMWRKRIGQKKYPLT